eukprot:CAMPEP_0114119726 /NCGR_PEP_ID=MMETSP0043_2-20121206/6265_1 /TAXON_ID=464988 /ORGANISM="Hemiselmis andersenii, Strain CCMP644" /LENGTH=273 /DNA_ID=CAMNT_0001212293 /DNA_START=165 /DNA_END=982 /DNA_ORIENTATION=-
MSCADAGDRGFEPQELATIEAIGKTASSLSFISSSFIILCYAAFPDLRKFAFKLVFFLSISDMMSSIPGFLPMNGQCPVCLAQAWLYSIFANSSVFWTACITHCLWRALVHHDVDVARFERYYHLVSWVVPLFFAVLPQLDGAYGPAGAWCWIVRSKDHWRYIQFFIPLWLIFAFNLTLYVKLILRLRAVWGTGGGSEGSSGDMKVFWRLGLYPVILVICWTAASVNRIHNSIYPSQPIYWLTCTQVFLSNSAGCWNCLAYGLNSNVRDKLRG